VLRGARGSEIQGQHTYFPFFALFGDAARCNKGNRYAVPISTAMNDTTAAARPTVAEGTTFIVLFAVSFCHLLNDMMQALLPAIYPSLKAAFHLSFAQVGFVTLAFQCTASLLQPAVGFYADKRPLPYSLPIGMVFTLAGLVLLSLARNYPMLLASAALIGVGSSTFHPESSRVARMASGGRHGLAQSMFQVGGNIGSALGPLTAAFVVFYWGQRSIAWYSGIALLAIVILYNVGTWYKLHGLRRLHFAHAQITHLNVSRRRVMSALAILIALVFTKYLYLTSITNYLTFFLIHRFHVSVRVAQFHLFLFLLAVAIGTFVGGPIGDRIGRKFVIWFSILGALPFSLMLPYANLFWSGVLSFAIGGIIASAFSAIVVYGQELVPGKVGTISGLFFGLAFGVAGLGAALVGAIADATSIEYVYRLCAFLPALGLLAVLLPHVEEVRKHVPEPAN
jgi:FSR family fosmidomycin resistance protein-like MFS transporter